MPNKLLVLLNYRAGSTLFQTLCQHTPQFFDPSQKANPGETFYHLPTLPPLLATHTHSGAVLDVVKNVEEDMVLMTHLGDWWGSLESRFVPGPYAGNSQNRFGPAEVRPYIDDGWKIVQLLRDGRNQIESFRKLKGGVEQKLVEADANDYFLRLCMSYRNKARVALDCVKEYPGLYSIYKFEDLVKEPDVVLASIFGRVGYDIDRPAIMAKFEKSQKIIKAGRHTSFPKDTSFNKRSLSWTPEEKAAFVRIARNEHTGLGYPID